MPAADGLGAEPQGVRARRRLARTGGRAAVGAGAGADRVGFREGAPRALPARALAGVAPGADRAPRPRSAPPPASAQDLILSDQNDERVQELVGGAFANTLEAVYGPPEYGGNHGLVGWRYTDWPGDTQPRGFSPAEVGGPGASGGRLGPG